MLRSRLSAIVLAATAALCTVAGPVSAQQVATIGFKSVGRAWPLAADLRIARRGGGKAKLQELATCEHVPTPTRPHVLRGAGKARSGPSSQA